MSGADDLLAEALSAYLADDDSADKAVPVPAGPDAIARAMGFEPVAVPVLPPPMAQEDPAEREVTGPFLRAVLARRAEIDPDRAAWPAEWFDTHHSGQISACRHLWCSVLLGCLQDAFRAVLRARAQPERHRPGHLRAALVWIGSQGFREVCELAGFDAGRVAAWARSEAERDDPGSGLFSPLMGRSDAA